MLLLMAGLIYYIVRYYIAATDSRRRHIRWGDCDCHLDDGII